MLQEALALHQKGELEKARALYEKLLQQEPANSDVLHLLGVVLHQTGDSAAGVRLIEHAIRLSPKQSTFYNNLGEALRGCQRWLDAAKAYKKAVEITPQLAGGWYWLGVCLWQLNELPGALEALSNALILKPEQIHWRMGLAQIYRTLQRWPEAVQAYCAVLEVDPRQHDALLNLGDVLIKSGDPEQASTVLANLVAQQPNWALGWCNYALALQQQGKLEEAEFAIANTLRLAPDYALGHLNAAVIAQCKGDYAGAVRESQQALTLDANLVEARFNLANYQLMLNDPAGWDNFSARWLLPAQALPNFAEYHHFSAPEWQGEPLTGKHIVVFPEQGIGDSLQFMRYLQPLVQMAAKVSVGVVEPLKRLVRALAIDVEWIDDVKQIPPADFKVAMLSLPGLLHSALHDALPPLIPFRQDAFADKKDWREGLASSLPGKKKVGLVWSGSVTQSNNRFRRLPLTQLKRLAELTDAIEFVLLQKGLPAEEMTSVQQALHAQDWSADCVDFYDTAAAIRALDAVICVDTSVAHLTGMLGVRGWVCLSTIADWRWRGETQSDYYPSLQLLKQPVLNDWESVVQQLMQALREF
ncbi:MAG TPA: tetratricopeptide repeat protein [Pseudomonadales bacterium]|nr:tetratricopeptide repeat protein [Pseudomonadales bacterium]